MTDTVCNATYRLRISPRSPWRTPWQADTLTGMLCAVCAQVHGADTLRRRLIEPMLAGQPPFVLSDACPGDLLPTPLMLRLREWPADEWKRVKQGRWIKPETFWQVVRDQTISPEELRPSLFAEEDVSIVNHRYHNTLSRRNDSSGTTEAGLGLFSRPDTYLRTHVASGTADPVLAESSYLSVYLRAFCDSGLELALELFGALSQTGFGADVATGRGQFEVAAEPDVLPQFKNAPEGANGVICLSTFQPGRDDPTEGVWEAFPKFGKLGPQFGVSDVQKRPVILFRPGACFCTDAMPSYLGRAIPMREFVPTTTASELSALGVEVIHPAFSLTVPAKFNTEFAP